MTLLALLLLAALALVSTAGAGLELDLAQLRQTRAWQGAVIRQLVANLFVVPLGTLVFLRLVPLPDDAALALWLVALSPGGASSPLLARLAGGEATRTGSVYVALCMSSLLTIPLVLPHVAAGASAGPWLLWLGVGLQLLPLLVGLVVRARHGARAQRYAQRLRKLGSTLLGAVVVLLIATRASFLATLGATTLLGIGVVVLLSLAAGAALATRPRLPDALLACVRNLTLALLVSEASRPGGTTTLIIAAQGLVMYVFAAVCLRAFAVRSPVVQEAA